MNYSNYTKGESFVELDLVDDEYLLTYKVFGHSVQVVTTSDFVLVAKMFSDIKSAIKYSKE